MPLLLVLLPFIVVSCVVVLWVYRVLRFMAWKVMQYVLPRLYKRFPNLWTHV